MAQPLFSVVIPSIGNKKLVEDSLKSVLKQSFTDFEVVVSDNSGLGSLLPVIQKYKGYNRIRYLSTDKQLSMPDHWEFATTQTLGEYILILTDKSVLKPSALSFLHEAITKDSRPEVISWNDDCSFDDTAGFLGLSPYSGSAETWNTADLLEAFTKFHITKTRMPHALNSCCRTDLVRAIRAKVGRMFLPACPDWTSAFLLLYHCKSLKFYDTPLIIRHGDFRLSNGAMAVLRGPSSYASTLGDLDILADAPLRIFTGINGILSDLFRIQRLMSGNTPAIILDMPGYMVANYEEIALRERQGASWGVRKAFIAWKDFLEELPHEQQSQILAELKRKKVNRKPVQGMALRLADRIGLYPYCIEAWSKIRAMQHRLKGGKIYRDVHEAAEDLDQVLNEAWKS